MSETEQRIKHHCYICNNEGFVPVRGGLYRCYREICIYRDERGLTGEIPKRICYVCGRVGETMDKAGEYKGISLYRCVNNNFCTNKLIKGVKLLYTDQGVIKYTKYPRGTLKDHPLIFLNQLELEELKKQELKERIEQLKDPSYKPTLIEFCILSLQEKWYTHQELADKFKANISTIKSTVPSIIKKQGYNVITGYNENKVLMYKIEEFKKEQPSTAQEQKVTQVPDEGVKNPEDVGIEEHKDSPVVVNILNQSKEADKVIEELVAKVKLSATQKRALNKLTTEWQNYKVLGEYRDVLGKLVSLGLAEVNGESYKKK